MLQNKNNYSVTWEKKVSRVSMYMVSHGVARVVVGVFSHLKIHWLVIWKSFLTTRLFKHIYVFTIPFQNNPNRFPSLTDGPFECPKGTFLCPAHRWCPSQSQSLVCVQCQVVGDSAYHVPNGHPHVASWCRQSPAMLFCIVIWHNKKDHWGFKHEHFTRCVFPLPLSGVFFRPLLGKNGVPQFNF